jgi:Zn-dependent M28 family amino/carboxypeptidase
VARHFVDTAAHTRRPEFAKLAAYYNLDNGGGAIRGPMVDQREQLKTEADSTFRVWTRLLRDLGADIVSARGGGGSDHVSFYERGLPGFQFLQDGLDYDTRTHHTNMDTYERVVPEDVRRNAVIVASFVFLTANREKPFPVMRVW